MTAFDPRALLDEYGDETLVRELAQLLIETVPLQIEAVRSAVATGDSSALRAAAHKLRGSIGPFGMPDAVETARNPGDGAFDRLRQIPARTQGRGGSLVGLGHGKSSRWSECQNSRRGE